MNKFEVGQRIVIAHSFVHAMNGMTGEIVEDGAKEGCDWLVLLDGASRPIKANSYELAPVAAEPTADGGGVDAFPELELDSLDYALAMLQSEFKGGDILTVLHHFKAIDQWKDEALQVEADLRSELASVQADNQRLQASLEEAVEAFTELLGVVAISSDISQYDFNLARKAVQQMVKDAGK